VELWTVLAPILLAGGVNPVLFGAVLVPLLLLAIAGFFLVGATWYLLRGESLVAL
jgi:hypothetical protein